MASTILLGVVTAISAAITAGHQHALEAQTRVAGTLAAEALISRIIRVEYDDLATWDGFLEAPGAMLDEHGQPMPDSFWMIGREVNVESSFFRLDPPGVNVRGRTVTVRAFDDQGREIIALTHFLAEPKEDSGT
ncbi:MAG: hypothetical protein ACR2GY_09035 [Phycisphaerales bacterium]